MSKALVWSLPMRNWNPQSITLDGTLSRVWSLPMRNWNNAWKAEKSCPVKPFEAYLWGIETPSKKKIVPFRELFEAYLWGIETPWSRRKGDRREGVWSLPMRNWNSVSLCSSPEIKFAFEAYLWGIETQTSCRIWGQPNDTVWSLPMRNWNYKIIALSNRNRASLKPTYEELKRWNDPEMETEISVWSLPMRNWNFSFVRPTRTRMGLKPTYEELKQIRSTSSSSSSTSSLKPTYEELKPSYRLVDGGKGFSVWSLPMRNWNVPAFLPLWAPCQFEAYLWGIETKNNDTRPLQIQCLKPTYEELKRASYYISLSIMIRLKPTYEELKHHQYGTYFFCFALFEAYLWGIETIQVNRQAIIILVWSLPMRNWNRSCPHRLS